MREAVVFVPGIWMPAWEFLLLRRYIAGQGYDCYYFQNRSLLLSPRANAQRLQELLNRLDVEVIHLVAHSLGGLVVLHLFDLMPVQKPGRVVMMGTPIKGSEVARGMSRNMLLCPLLGKSIQQGLLGDVPRWKGHSQLGMIAGSRRMGIGGLLFGNLQQPSDGTVALAETRSADVSMHLTVPYGHSGMLFSTQVAAAICSFLKKGDFEP